MTQLAVSSHGSTIRADGGEREVKGPGLGIVHENGTNYRYTDVAPGVYVPMVIIVCIYAVQY